MVAQFFLDLSDHGSAIQFLLLSNQSAEAFKLAQTHGKMDLYARYVGNSASADDFSSVALVFEKEGNFLQAGHFFIKAGSYDRAVKSLLKVKYESGVTTQPQLDLLIEAAGAAQSDSITKQVVAHLAGDDGTEPKVGEEESVIDPLFASQCSP
jgi:WD repeat-containing protein 19